MIYIECPNERTEESFEYPALFMAGGITGCSQWQNKMVEQLKDEKITLLNPRRANYDVLDPAMEAIQITWEHTYLSKCDAVSFWFTSDTVQPITLFELGTFCPVLPDHLPMETHIEISKQVFVGVNPDYKRISDIKFQLGLRRRDIEIVFDFDELISQIKEWCRMY